MNKSYKIRIKKGDTVTIRSGKYKDRSGKVLQVHPKLNKVTVEGINVVKKHRKPTQANPQGGIFEITKPIWVSKVGITEPQSNRPSRIGYQGDGDGGKKRIYRLTGKETKS